MNLTPAEKKRRKRELLTIGIVSALFLVLTWILFKMFGISEQLPFQHSIFFFGLVNFNIILFLLLAFLIFRNVVKQFAEREGGPIGSSLKSKLIAAFVGFSFVPTALMFVVSVFYINNSFDRWFNEKISGILKSSIEVTTAHYLTAKKSNYHFADEISKELARQNLARPQLKEQLQEKLEALREKFNIDALEYYPGLLQDRVVTYNKSDGVPEPPPVSLEFREKGIKDRNNSSVIHHFAEGDLVRVIVPVPGDPRAPDGFGPRAPGFGPRAPDGFGRGAIVASSYIPMSLISRMDDIASALENFRDTDPLAYPIKSIYLIILVLMTLVILLGATWFGFYLARQLSIPLERLAQATQRVLKGEYGQVSFSSGSPEINRLINNFNVMTDHLGRSEKEIQEANQNLQKTLSQLDEHNRYIEIVLEHVTTGVISVNQENVVTMMNRHAERLLDIDAEKRVGRPVQEVLSQEYYRLFDDLVMLMKSNNDARALQKEVQISVKGRPLLLSMTISILTDDEGRELGKILVFDDLTPLISAQRAAAWTEVARRIAHEIKNPLTPISLAAQRLQRKFAQDITDPAFIDCTKMIIDQVDDLKMLVNEFSQFARMPRSKPVLADLNQTIADALQLFHQSKKNYALKFSADPRLPQFLFDPDLIRRALNNLVDNAVDGVQGENNAEIVVETQYDPMTRVVRLAVADNGRGIPAYLKSRIFEPYVTTKKQGTGLGLAIVKRTVEDHNGYVRALDNQPRGTRFVIELPVILSNTASDIVVSSNEKDFDV